jgi:hypothetical protein
VLRKSPKADPPYRPDEIPTAPACRRFITNDATKEKLQAILGENPGGLLSYQDELAGWFRQLDSSGHEGESAFSWRCGTGLDTPGQDNPARPSTLFDRHRR